MQALAVAKELGERTAVFLQGPGPAAVPAIFEIDADQFAQHRAVEGMAGIGEELLQVNRFAAAPRLFKERG